MGKFALALILLAAIGSSQAMAGSKPSNPTRTASSSALNAAAPTPSTTDGTINSLDPMDCTVTLANSHVYHFGATCDLAAFKIGEKVAITWTASGAVYNASAITAA